MKIIDNKKMLNNLKKQIMTKLSELVELADEEKKGKSENIKEMIRHYYEETSIVEEARNRINRFSLQIFAMSVAGLGIIISQITELRKSNLGELFFWSVTSCFIVLIISVFCSTVFYQFQSWYRYPFLMLSEQGFEEYGNRWKWFYYGNKEILNINPNPFLSKKRKIRGTIEPYMKGLLNFVTNYRDEDLNSEIIADVIQLYLLQVYNYYKNRFNLQLTKIWLFSFVSISLIVFTSILFYVFKYLIN